MAITFTTDVRPLFRAKDITCMTPGGVRLDDPAWMCDHAGDATYPDHANANRVFAALSAGKMPPDGAWPAERLAIYRDWMTGGFIP